MLKRRSVEYRNIRAAENAAAAAFIHNIVERRGEYRQHPTYISAAIHVSLLAPAGDMKYAYQSAPILRRPFMFKKLSFKPFKHLENVCDKPLFFFASVAVCVFSTWAFFGVRKCGQPNFTSLCRETKALRRFLAGSAAFCIFYLWKTPTMVVVGLCERAPHAVHVAFHN